MSDIRVIDDYGIEIAVGRLTLNGGRITAISDEDLNSSGTGTEVWITVEYGDSDAVETERWPARFTWNEVYVCDEVKMA
jgi:hypothetical protein